MIFIYFSDIIKWIRHIYSEDEAVKRICNIILFSLSIISIIGVITFALTLTKNVEKSRLASFHYECWIEQLPSEHPIKKDVYGLVSLYSLQNSLSLTAGALFDSQEQILKYEFGTFDLTELGALEAYLSKKFDESKPEYLLVDETTNQSLDKIKLIGAESRRIKFYRNDKEMPFNYMPPENIWNNNDSWELHELISLGFVKAYVQNPNIAKIVDNQITALSKGKTKLILIYGTQLLEIDIVVKK